MNKLLRILVMFAVILTACSRRSDFTDALRCADAVLCEHPDSALAILQALDTNGISDSQRAHYALLDAKASDKSYIIQTDASPIARAADYYRGHGDSLEVQSAYYYGLALMIEKDYKNALSELTEAFDIAEKAGDNFYQGMATRELAGVYHSLLMSKESLYWAEIAKDRFIKANKPVMLRG